MQVDYMTSLDQNREATLDALVDQIELCEHRIEQWEDMLRFPPGDPVSDAHLKAYIKVWENLKENLVLEFNSIMEGTVDDVCPN